MVWAAGVSVCPPSGKGENCESGKNNENGMGCWGVGCVLQVKMMKIVKMECAAGGVGCVPFMKRVKMVWAAGVWVCTPSGNGENFGNG